jgi:hypothetical protein
MISTQTAMMLEMKSYWSVVGLMSKMTHGVMIATLYHAMLDYLTYAILDMKYVHTKKTEWVC